MRKCKVEGCINQLLAKGYCNKHYKQVKMFGRVKRTMNDPNEIIINGDKAEVVLYDNKGIEKSRALVDIEDVGAVKKHKWHDKEGYACTFSDGNRISMHRLIMKPSSEKVVDHINHNTLDNTKSNLRICTAKDNSWNTKNSIGVYYRKDRNRWHARITKDGQRIYLGYFVNKEDAIRARIKGEKKYFGEFAPNRSDCY